MHDQIEYNQTFIPSWIWVHDSLCDAVRLNGTRLTDSTFQIGAWRELPRQYAEYFDVDNIPPHIVHPRYSHSSTDQQILEVLFNSNFRRGNRDTLTPYLSYFEDKISAQTNEHRPIEIVLPTLPFKDQNPLTTNLPPQAVDLGEYLLFAQLRDLDTSIRQVYPPGTHINILCDGLVYLEIFTNCSEEEIIAYREQCQKILDEFGLQDVVNIIDMSSLVSADSEFSLTRNAIRDMLAFLNQHRQLGKIFHSLERGMIMNVPITSDYDQAVTLMLTPQDQLPSDIARRINNAALDYASFLLAISYRQIISNAFPDSIRGTVHLKKAPQLPLHLVNKHSHIFPYNGVPVVSARKLHTSSSFKQATRITRYCEALACESIEAIYRPEDLEPFYYLVP